MVCSNPRNAYVPGMRQTSGKRRILLQKAAFFFGTPHTSAKRGIFLGNAAYFKKDKKEQSLNMSKPIQRDYAPSHTPVTHDRMYLLRVPVNDQ